MKITKEIINNDFCTQAWLNNSQNIDDLKEAISREAVRCRSRKQTTSVMFEYRESVMDSLRFLNKMLTNSL